MNVTRALAASLWATALAAQSVLTVGPGGYPEIVDAIAAASDGDIVQVASGTYAPFTCGKNLTIAAVPGATVEVVPPFFFSGAVQFHVPGGSVHVRGLHFFSPGVFFAIPCWVTGGTVSFEQCQWTGGLGTPECLRVDTASVLLRDCEMSVGTTAFCNPALRATGSRVVAIDSRFYGSDLSVDGGNCAGPGIEAKTTTLHLVRCHAQGGFSYMVTCFYPSGDGVVTDRGQYTWIVDSELVGGDLPCGTPGVGLRVTSVAPAHLTRTTVTAGTGAVTMPAVVGPWVSDNAIGLQSPTQNLQIGAPYQVDYVADPFATLIVFASIDLDTLVPFFTVETTWLPIGDLIWFDTLVADANGLAVLQAMIPNLPVLRDAGIWLHALDLLQDPWRIAPPVGGLLR